MPRLTRGSNHLRFLSSQWTWRLNTDMPLSYLVDETCFHLHGPMSLLFEPDETLGGGIEETARQFEEDALAYWRH